uniref:G_PROTEIN_RECEP_F1_2 domain-containing protein n=1 Tax=Steinernema glaseri TaxID=37863 RepID=A0A1I7Z1L6_9BILA
MRYVSHFILNEMAWNLAANLLYTFAHPIPMMPENCFRLDGLIGDLFPQEYVGHIIFMSILLAALNCVIALMLCFQFRYMSLSHKNRIRHIRPLWGYLYCAGIQVSVSCLFVFYYLNWLVPLSDYPNQSVITSRMFCFHSSGFRKGFALFSFFGSTLLALLFMVLFNLLCLRRLHQQEGLLDARTVRLQKKLLRNLMILAAVPTLIGFLPILVAVVLVYRNDLTYSREISTTCIIIALNHGTVYGIVTIMLFKAYRAPIRQIFMKVRSKILFQKNNQLASNVIVWTAANEI